MASFVSEGKKPKGGASSNPPSNMLNFGTPGNTQGSPTSDGGGSSDSGDENDDSPLAPPGTGAYGNAGHPVQNVGIYSNMGWSNSIKM